MKKIDIVIIIQIITGMLLMTPIHLLTIEMDRLTRIVYFGNVIQLNVFVDSLLCVFYLLMLSAIICFLIKELK